MDISTPRYVAEPVRVAAGSPAMPDLTDVGPEPTVSRSDDGRVKFSLSVGALAGIIGGAVVVAVLFGTSLYSLGSQASKDELKPIISDQANRALGGDSEATPPADLTLREPPRDPIQRAEAVLTPEPPVVNPVVDDPTPETDDADAGVEPSVAQIDPPATEPSNVDTREAGLNYMYTSMTFDRDEAVEAQQFLFDNGLDSIIEELTRASDGQKAYRLWTLVGIPGQGFNTSREKFEHERAIFDLGNEWLTERGGRLDFSRPGQIGWIKYGG